jgi:nucleotide-binding universal stress UspA family protein
MRILVATGGAQHSEIAVRQVAELGKVMPVSATVLTVIKHAEDQKDADAVLAKSADILRQTCERVSTKSRVGSVGEEIVAEGESGRYDLIVLGQRPSRSIFARFRGQVTRYVVDHSTLPILIAKGQPQPLERILICDSGAKSPSLLQQFRLHLPGILGNVKDITVLHVMSQISAYPTVMGADLTASAEDLMKSHSPEGTWLEQDVEYLEQMQLSTTAKVRHGLVIDEIVAEARAGNYDLVVIGAHRTENLPRFLLDDQARELVGEIDRATLVVR